MTKTKNHSSVFATGNILDFNTPLLLPGFPKHIKSHALFGGHKLTMLDFDSLSHFHRSRTCILGKGHPIMDGSGHARGHFFGELSLITEKLKVPHAVCPDWYWELQKEIRGKAS